MSINCLRGRIPVLNFIHRLSTTTINKVKEIRETTDGNVTVIEGITVESPRKNYLLQPTDSSRCCCLCRYNLDLQHTDVLILSQFVQSDGTVLSPHITGLCSTQHHLVTNLVLQAQKAGLMPLLTSTTDTSMNRNRFRGLNRYFDPGTSGNKTKRYL